MQATEQQQKNGQTTKPGERLAQRIFLGGSIIAFVLGLFYLLVAMFNPDMVSSIVEGSQEVVAQALVAAGWLLTAIFLQLLLAITRIDNR